MPDLLFAHDFPPMGGGIARWMEAMARGYPAGTLTVSTGTCAGQRDADQALPNRVDRIAVPSDRLKTVQGWLRWCYRAMALAREPGVRFSWCDSVRPAGYPAHRAFRASGVPFGIIVHGGDLFTLRRRVERSGLKRQVVRALLRDAAVYVANSEWTAAQCRALLHDLDLPDHVARVRVVLLGTDPVRLRPDPVAARTFRTRRRLPDGRWLVTVARLVAYKGIDSGIELVARLASSLPDLHYAVIGRGEEETPLRALAERLGVADRVHFLTDVSDDELPAAYASADIYLGLTRETGTDIEGFGISFLEAAATALPVVATLSGGIPDAVADGVTGLLVEPDHLDRAVEAVSSLFADPGRMNRLGAAGRERVLAHFTWPRVIAEMQAIAAERGRRTTTGDRAGSAGRAT